jgi:hypothetical protein
MDSEFNQITHGLVVGGLALPVLSGVVGAAVSLLTGSSVRMLTATRLVFVALGIGVLAAVTSARIPASEGVACLVAQLVAWSVLLGPQRRKKQRRKKR